MRPWGPSGVCAIFELQLVVACHRTSSGGVNNFSNIRYLFKHFGEACILKQRVHLMAKREIQKKMPKPWPGQLKV